MQLQRSEVVALTGISTVLIITGVAWLLGPFALIVSGLLLLAVALFVDF